VIAAFFPSADVPVLVIGAIVVLKAKRLLVRFAAAMAAVFAVHLALFALIRLTRDGFVFAMIGAAVVWFGIVAGFRRLRHMR
jgi:hypothetical protein